MLSDTSIIFQYHISRPTPQFVDFLRFAANYNFVSEMRNIKLFCFMWFIPVLITLYLETSLAERDYEDRFDERRERNRRHSDERDVDARNSRPRREKDEEIERIVVKMKHRRDMLKRRLEEVDEMFKNHESGQHVMDTETKTHMERQHTRLLQQINDPEYVDNHNDSRYRRVSITNLQKYLQFF